MWISSFSVWDALRSTVVPSQAPAGDADPVATEDIQATVARRIRQYAKAANVPLSDIPDLANVSHSHFWEVLRGESDCGVLWLTYVAGALGVHVRELVDPED